MAGWPSEPAYEPLHRRNHCSTDEEQTLAETLREQGYAAAIANFADRDPTTMVDEATTGWHVLPLSVLACLRENARVQAGRLLHRQITDAAIVLMGNPIKFFVHLEHFSVHDPIQGRKDLVDKYQKKLAAMPPQSGTDYILETNPDGPFLSKEELEALEENDAGDVHQQKRVWWVKQKQDNVEFAGMVEATDESLGRIRQKLKELGLEENTIIIFTADNGGMAASNQYRGINHSREILNTRFASSNLPVRQRVEL